MNARLPSLVGITLLASIMALALAGGVGATRYRDAAGAVGPGGGPDVVAIVVSNDAKRVTSTVRFATAPPLDVSANEKWWTC